ncbi:DNA polymerase III subunit beta [Rhizobium sp. Root1203]|uniref:DNA polymerase III subunit beta n=1 Tax=Rhizobium sp. Root1203 TaxID=1736427 RepID=UPI0007090BCB|nr:DNA polymerase III subunit beta [Rhizobium sp. Root1203]KQV27567.1 DNA polymerase III subunit beta [Rhizobium sp. Root1203]
MFTAEKSALMAALALSTNVVEKRNTIPILQNVLIEKGAAAGTLNARLTNLDIEASTPFKASAAIDFEDFTVPAALLADIVRKLPDGCEVEVSRRSGTKLDGVTIKAGRSKFSLQVLPATDFPEMKLAGAFPHQVTLPAADLAAALGACSFAMSTEETRYYLNGIFMHPTAASAEHRGVVFVATDGHRLSKRFVTAESDPGMPGIIIPRQAIKVIEKILPKAGEVTIELSDTLIRISGGSSLLTSKLVDGTFPDYVRVVPQDSPMQATVDGATLGASIDRVATISGERGRAVRFIFAAGQLQLHVSNPDTGDATDELAYEGEASLEVGFNARYVNDVLSHLPGEQVLMGLDDAGGPAVLRNPGAHPENLIVLMPMRV